MWRSRQTQRNARGYVLVLFVMMFFGLMGLAALVIDMGFARLAQRQMQTAVDSAALEGLRWQAVTSTDHARPAAAGEPNRRRHVHRLRGQRGTVHYGAGPVVNFSGGVGPADLAAAQTMSPGPIRRFTNQPRRTARPGWN